MYIVHWPTGNVELRLIVRCLLLTTGTVSTRNKDVWTNVGVRGKRFPEKYSPPPPFKNEKLKKKIGRKMVKTMQVCLFVTN